MFQLELNIRPRVLSDEWLKHVDSVVTVGSASHIVTSKPRIPSRNTIGRKKSQFLDSEPHSSKNAASGLGLFWWRGGRLTRKLFSWKVLPHSLASKAARQGLYQETVIYFLLFCFFSIQIIYKYKHFLV